MPRSHLFSPSLKRLRALHHPAAIFMALITLLNGQQVAAQSACTSQPGSPTNTYPQVNPNLTLTISDNLLTLPTFNLKGNLANQITNSYNAPGAAPITVAGQGALPGTCTGAPYATLIQNWCGAPLWSGDVLQFQADAAQEFLSLFHIPSANGPAAVQMIIDRANTKLLASYFGYLQAELESWMNADASTLTQHQANVVAWFNSLVWQHEKDYYNAADQEKNAYLANPCGYVADSDLAAQYSLQFGNINQCQGLGAATGNPNVPPVAYFEAVGLKKSYGAALQSYPDGPVLNYGMLVEKDLFERAAFEMGTGLKTAWSDADQLGINTGIAGLTGLASFAASHVLLNATALGKSLFPYSYRFAYQPVAKAGKFSEDSDTIRAVNRIANNMKATQNAIEGVEEAEVETDFVGEDELLALPSEFADAALPTSLASAGPAAVVAIFVVILTQSIEQLQAYEQAKQDYSDLDTQTQSIQTQPPNAASFIGDATGEYKIAATLATVALPLAPFPQSTPTDQSEPNLTFRESNSSGGLITTSPRVILADWNLVPESVTLAGAWFSESEQVGSAGTVVSETPVIHYLDWNGRQWWAARFGNAFLAVKNGYERQSEGDAFQDVGACGDGTPSPMSDTALFQPQQASTGVANAYCSSFVAHTLHVKDQNGNNVVLEIGATPMIGSSYLATAVLQPGTTSTFPLQVTGYPIPTLTLGQPLLSGLQLVTPSDGSAPFILDNNITAPATRTQTVPIIASNKFGSFALQLEITENKGTAIPAIANSSPLAIQGGQPFSTTLHYTGHVVQLSVQSVSYTSTLSGGNANGLSGSLTGLTWRYSADGTAVVLSGTPVLNANFTSPPTGTPVTGSIQISALAGVPGIDNEIEGYNVTQSVPFTYTPMPDPMYPNTPVVLYTGQNNAVRVPSSVITTATPVIYAENVTGDGNCPFAFQLLSNPDGSVVVNSTVSEQQNFPAKHCTISFTAHSLGDDEPNSADFNHMTASIPITFLTIPQFTSIPNPVFEVGVDANFPVTVSSPGQISFKGTLPAGMFAVSSFDPSSGTSTLAFAGTPEAGSGGQYKIPLTVTSADGSSTQTLDMQVRETPSFTSPGWVNIPLNKTYTFNVTTAGYPNLASNPCDGMSFDVTPIQPPTAVASEATNKNLALDTTGVLKLTYPPVTSPGVGILQIVATNAAGSSSQALYNRYYVPGDANGDGQVSCADVNAIRGYLNTPITPGSSLVFLDLNNDGFITTKDLLLVTPYLPKGTRCQ